MKHCLILCVVAIAAVVCSAAPMVRLESAIESRPTSEWTFVRKAEPSATLRVQIAIKQSNLDILENIFWKVSNPSSSEYGRYLTTHEVGALVAPPRLRVVRVMDWVRSAGVAEKDMELSLHQDLLTVRLTARQAKVLFDADMEEYEHESRKQVLLRAKSYKVPEEMAKELDFVGGLVRFPSLLALNAQAGMAEQQGEKEERMRIMASEAKEERKRTEKETKGVIDPSVHRVADLTMEVNPKKFAGSANYPLQSSLINGDQWVLGDYLVRCLDGSPGYHSVQPGNPRTVSCQSTSPPSNYEAVVELSLSMSTATYSKNVSFTNCEYFDPTDTTNMVSLNRARLMKSLGLPIGDPNNRPMFCAIRIDNLPNYQPLQVSVRTWWPLGGPTYTASQTGLSLAQLGTLWTPSALKEFYNVPASLMNTNSENSQSVAEFLGEYYSERDLQRWMAVMDVESNTAVEVIGPNDESNPGGEATLDIQWMVGISPNVRTVFWSLGELHEGQEPFLQWLTDISNTPDAPLVHSVSYADEESTLSLEYMMRINVELQKAGVRGLSMLFASGDDGVLGYTSRNQSLPGCYNNAFQPQFPSSSPFATSVGGTVRIGGPDGQGSASPFAEAVASSDGAAARITSGGGFSRYFPQPSYQQAAVYKYLHSTFTPVGKFNSSNRAYPDISGMAHNYVCLLNGVYTPIDGTSASTPLIASFLTLINDKLLSLNRPPIGFFNPLLYSLYSQNSDIVRDVIEGDNGCTASRACCVNGFIAFPGWDAATGLGVPNFSSLLNAIINNPSLASRSSH